MTDAEIEKIASKIYVNGQSELDNVIEGVRAGIAAMEPKLAAAESRVAALRERIEERFTREQVRYAIFLTARMEVLRRSLNGPALDDTIRFIGDLEMAIDDEGYTARGAKATAHADLIIDRLTPGQKCLAEPDETESTKGDAP